MSLAGGRLGEAQKSRYRDILARCDYETMVQQSYTPGCMQRRNRYMVDHASLLIAVNDGARGGRVRRSNTPSSAV